MSAVERTDVINEEIRMCGYFDREFVDQVKVLDVCGNDIMRHDLLPDLEK